MDEPLLTMAEVSRLLGVSHEAIRDRVHRKTLRSVLVQVGCRQVAKIPASAVVAPISKGGAPKKFKEKTKPLGNQEIRT